LSYVRASGSQANGVLVRFFPCRVYIDSSCRDTLGYEWQFARCSHLIVWFYVTFAPGKDVNLKMLPPGPAPEHLTSIYGQAPYFLVISSTTGSVCSGLDLCAGLHIRTVKLVWGIPIVMSILQPSARASSSSSSTASHEQDSADDYPEIKERTCGDPIEEGRLIIMVAPAGGSSQNSSSRYPTIERSEVSDARTPNDRMIRNLNPDFNAIWFQTIIESIQWMTPKGCPPVALAQ
jgi:hypothetical protein